MFFLHISTLCIAVLLVNSGVQAATLPPPAQPTTAPTGSLWDVGGAFFGTTAPPLANNPTGSGSGTGTSGNQQPPPPSLVDILNDPALWALTGMQSGSNNGPVARPQSFPGIGNLNTQHQNLVNSVLPWAFIGGGENMGQVMMANTISNQLPGPMGPIFANQALDLPDPWLPVQMAQSVSGAGPQAIIPTFMLVDQMM